jgi:hypothetical protein
MDLAQLALVVAGQLVTAGAVYGGIRADIRNAIERAASAEARANSAHLRIDQLLLKEQHT